MEKPKSVQLNSTTGMVDSSVAAEGNMSGDLLSLEIFRDPSPGPLDEYRKRASFDWKRMKMFYYDEDILRFQVCLNRDGNTRRFMIYLCIFFVL